MTRLVQEEREAVVVFPFAYHQGFNHGFNMAEAVNFGSRRWVEYGKRARGCLCYDSRDAVKIEMTPFVTMYQPELLQSWKQGGDFQLHPEDPDYLHKFLKDARERTLEGKVTEGEWEEVRVTLRDMGSIPDWYEIKFGVRFGEQKKILLMDATHHDDEVDKRGALVDLMKQNAALRIQRWWRGKKNEEAERREEEASKREGSALVLQARWRGFQARRHFIAQKRLVLRLQSLARGFLLRQRLRKAGEAARLLQVWWRNFSVMRKVRGDFVLKKEAAASVQTWWRRVAESRRRKVLVRAAVTVQSYWRMRRERRLFLNNRSESGNMLGLNLSIGSDIGEKIPGGPADEKSQERRSTLVNKRECEEGIDQSSKRRRFECGMLAKVGVREKIISQNFHLADEVLKDEEEVNSEISHQLLTCTICGPELSVRTTLRQHMLEVHPSKCIWPACKMKFGTQVDLQLHVAAVHQEKELSQQQRKQKLKREELVDQADERVDCQVPGCGGSFEDFEAMVQHFKTTHQLKSRMMPKLRLKRTQALDLKRLEEAKKIANISQVLKDLTQRSKVRCDAAGCNKVFKKMVYMEAHMKLKHNKGSRHRQWRRCPAPWCEASFKMNRDQMAHFEQYHMVEIHICVHHTYA